MAQVLKLKRTAVSGKIPTTSQLELGELAINTFDGRIFFEKDNGTPSISEILVVNTTNPVTGSFALNGNISATNITLSGDLVVQGTTTTINSTTLNIGDNTIELNYGGSQTSGGILVKDATGASTISGSLLWDSTNDYWKLGTLGNESQIITISNLTSNLPNGLVSGSSQVSYTELSNTPSGIISGSSQLNGSTLSNMTLSGSFSGSFVGDGSGLTNLTTNVSEIATVTSDFTNQTSITVTHNFNTKNILVSVYDDTDSFFLPSSIVTTDVNSVTIGFSGIESGRVVVAKGGHIVTGIQEVSETATVTASFDNTSNINVIHNFNSRNVIVSVYDSNYSQLIPETLTLTDENSVDIVLSGNQSGHVVVAKGGHIVSGSVNAIANFTELTNVPNGLVSGSSQLTSSYDLRYALSGSVGGGSTDISSLNTFTQSIDTRVTTLESATGSYLTSLNGAISSSSQILDGSGIFSSSAQLPSGLVSGSSQIQFNSVSNTPFSQSVTQVTTTKSIVPTTSTIDLGTATNPFRDLYLSSASLYIDGQQVLSSAADTLTITTDVGQSIKLLETGADDIILQTDTGNIELKGTIEVLSGKKIVDSAATKILFGDTLGITGSIELTGTVDGVNISQLKSDFDNIEGKSLISGSSQISYLGLSNIPSGIVSGSTQVSFNGIPDKPTLVSGSSQIVYTSLSSIPSGIVSGSSQITAGSTTNFSTDVKGELNSNTVVSGSGQILTLVSIDEDTMSSNSDTKVPTQQSVKQYVDTKVASLVSGSPETLDTLNELATALGNDPNFATTVSNQIGGKVSQSLQVIAGNGLSGGGDLTTNRTLDVVSANNGIIVNSDNIQLDTTSTTFTSGVKTKLNTDSVVSGSSQVIGILSSLNSYTSSNDTTNTTQNSRLTSIESATGSYETKGSGIVSGSSQVSYTGLSSIPSGIVSGSSQITLSSTSGYGSVLNQAVLTSSSPTFAGGTLTGAFNGTSANFNGNITLNGAVTRNINFYNDTNSILNAQIQYDQISSNTGQLLFGTNNAGTFATRLTIASTGAANFSSSVSGNALTLYTSYANGRQLNFGFSDGSVLPTAAFYVGNQTAVGVFIGDETTTNGLYVKQDGNVGIGTTSPGAKLDILGTSGNITTDTSNGTLINIDGGSITSTNFGVGIGFVRTGSQMAYIKAARENDSDEASFLSFATQTAAGSHPERMRITSTGTVQPGANGTQDLGSSSYRWSTIYTSDLSLNNGIGDWTIVEGEDDLFLYNNKKGKVYKFALTEVDPSVATPKKS